MDEEDGDREPSDPSELESWFDDVGAPAKTLRFLTSASFPLSPNYIPPKGGDGKGLTQAAGARGRGRPSVLDLGTGNGSALFSLRLEGGYLGRMVGVDYSVRSVELAQRLWKQYPSSMSSTLETSGEVEFEVFDVIHDDPTSQPWWPQPTSNTCAPRRGGFDLVLDKGTFDAISLSSSTAIIRSPDNSCSKSLRICELYPSKVAVMVKPGGFFLITSCNWTEEEVVAWFTREGEFEVYNRIQYPVFEFAGQKGQGVASVCFRRLEK